MILQCLCGTTLDFKTWQSSFLLQGKVTFLKIKPVFSLQAVLKVIESSDFRIHTEKWTCVYELSSYILGTIGSYINIFRV